MIALPVRRRAAALPIEPLRPIVVELVGPAAAGKTSLLLALHELDPTLRAGLRPARHHHWASAVTLGPTFLALHRPYRGLLWKEMKRITYLGTLQRLLHKPALTSLSAVVLDEGAVYMLARLRVLGGERIRTGAFERWWLGAIERWARLLDVVVWLDAPDVILMHRLRSRRQSHSVKGLSDEAICRFLASYRDAYERVMAALTRSQRVRVLVVRTDEESVNQIVGRVASEIRELRCRDS